MKGSLTEVGDARLYRARACSNEDESADEVKGQVSDVWVGRYCGQVCPDRIGGAADKDDLVLAELAVSSPSVDRKTMKSAQRLSTTEAPQRQVERGQYFVVIIIH
jgi:hypothetical protein